MTDKDAERVALAVELARLQAAHAQLGTFTNAALLRHIAALVAYEQRLDRLNRKARSALCSTGSVPDFRR
jgi:hypothetical protein